MANAGNEGQPPAREEREKGPLDALLDALGLRRKSRSEAGEGEERSGSDLVDQAWAFQAMTVADVMIPRADIVALEIATPFEAVVAQFLETEHSRLPIYRETLDDPVGFVHIKDLFKLMAGKVRRPGPQEAVLGRLRRESLYVPPSMRAADLLLRMQASRIHLGMVIDEFGGVDGLVTLEDVIEAVVGDIDDEHDEAAVAHILARAGGVFEVDARADLDEIQAALGRDLTTPDLDEEIDTIAGLVTAVAGRVPQRGEVVVLDDELEAEVLDADPRRIKRLRLRPTVRPSEPPAEAPAA
ncbi:MAG: HlyC/CorC family transporter [Caulobacteraceae bacterium]|nr:HlyC/CorC family transporter [Caulobacteraceae bacterium]